jgi:hypothetical protein
MSARSRSSSSRSSSYWRRRVMPSSSASVSFQNHPGFGEGTKAALDVQIEPVVLSQDMFHLHNGAKQRLARKLVGRLCLTRWRLLSCSSLPRKRPCRLRQVTHCGPQVAVGRWLSLRHGVSYSSSSAKEHTCVFTLSDAVRRRSGGPIMVASSHWS